MIVRCPECQTGFNLPLEKVGQKGAKVRCSKCNHVFRVRKGFDGRAEIFYNAASSADPPTRELSDDMFAADYGKTQLGAPVTSPPNFNPSQGNATAIGIGGGAVKRETQPTPVNRQTVQTQSASQRDDDQTRLSAKPSPRRAEVSKSNFNPFGGAKIEKKQTPRRTSILTPTPKRDLKDIQDIKTPPPLTMDPSRKITPPVGLTPPPKAGDSGMGIDLFDDDESGFGAHEKSVGDDPFAGAFMDDSTDDLFGSLSAGLENPGISSGSLTLPSQPIDEPLQQNQWNAPKEEPASIPVPVETNDDFFFQQRDTEFGAADDLVDPDFGKDVPSLDASYGLINPGSEPAVEQPKAKRRTHAAPAEKAPELAITSPPPKHPNAQQTARPAPAIAEPTATSSMIHRAAFEPHRIGGSMGQRIFSTIFIVIIIMNGFVLLIAALSDWKFDFSRPLYMLEVAFEDKPFDENNAVVPAPVTNNSPEILPAVTADFEAEVGRQKRQHLMIVRGVVNNPNAANVGVPEISVTIEVDGESKDAAAVIGSDLALTDFDPKAEPKISITEMEPNASVPFHAVFLLDKAPKVYSFSVTP